jgi:hypothetical protein
MDVYSVAMDMSSEKKISFVVPGPIMGYRASVARAHDPKYKAYKERVRLCALAAGFRFDDEGCRHPVLSVSIYWKRSARIDWSNVVKAIEDALWKRDRHVDPGVFCVFRDSGREEAVVEIALTRRDR